MNACKNPHPAGYNSLTPEAQRLSLCRQYQVDSLYEAIDACREELAWLITCAERLEPLPPLPTDYSSANELERERDDLCRNQGISRYE